MVIEGDIGTVLACAMMVKGVCLLHVKHARWEHVYGVGLSAAHSLGLRKPVSAHHHTPISEAEGEGGAHALRHEGLKERTLHSTAEEHCCTAQLKAWALIFFQFQ
jgi:hypothetical protein